jgi:hypothetical protein
MPAVVSSPVSCRAPDLKFLRAQHDPLPAEFALPIGVGVSIRRMSDRRKGIFLI